MPPEPEGSAPQAEQTAEKETTTETPQAEVTSTTDPVMDAMGVDPDIQAQITPKAEEPKAETEPEKDESETSEAEQEEVERPETEPEEDEEEDEKEELKPVAESEKPDKRLKRINRLTRQRNEAREQAEKAEKREQELIARLEKLEGKKEQEEHAAPIGTGRLSHIKDEESLSKEVAKANAIIEWCDINPNGANDDKGEFIEPEQVAAMRRNSEKVILNAPERRDQIRTFTSAKSKFDALAREELPEMFDRATQEYQWAANLKSQFPWIKEIPQGEYSIGLLVEGIKAREARIKRNGEKPKEAKPRDISPRAFEPRVPIAPHTANPPSREVRPSPKTKQNEAMADLIKDPDGSAESLARVFAADEEAEPSGRKMAKV
jgi:hypothetical protein